MTLGQKVRQARIERGLTQQKLVGDQITRNMLSKIENDSATPSMRTLEFLARQLGLPTSYFMSDFSLSDGTSPDGLDKMRAAYKEGRYQDCIDYLEEAKTVGSTDEGYLLHALACIGAAKNALANGDIPMAKEYADGADYYNKQGLYYSVQIDAEMSLILAECSLILDMSEFDKNIEDFEKAAKNIGYSDRYKLAKAEYLICINEKELASKIIDSLTAVPEELQPKVKYVSGLYSLACGRYDESMTLLKEAESIAVGSADKIQIYKALEQCCLRLEDYKGAYMYADKQRNK